MAFASYSQAVADLGSNLKKALGKAGMRLDRPDEVAYFLDDPAEAEAVANQLLSTPAAEAGGQLWRLVVAAGS
eukprot:3545433-Lingulodinium_polyedra.AAC.1